jgi:5-methyltetrahydrofolate--homocysteine methyltransferase
MAKDEALFAAVGRGRRNEVVELVEAALAAGTSADELVADTLIPAMRDVGERFSRHEIFVPEMLVAARAMQAGLKVLEPVLAESGHQSLGKVAIGTVKGDLHDIGKNLVVMMLRGAGYDVIDLGVDCDTAKFDEGVAAGAQLVLASALLTTTMPYLRDVVAHYAGNDAVKVVVGGAPVTQGFADEIGAAGYGADANDAVTIVDRLVQAA